MHTLSGNLFILSAPSGAGKSSLIQAMLDRHNSTLFPLQVSVSHTTRQPRPGEEDGVHYHFVSRTEFEQQIQANTFFEWAEVFDNYYGTSRLSIEDCLQQGIDVFLDIDWQGARQVKAALPDAVSIFIAPPSKQTLLERLTSRGQDSDEVIASRMAEAVAEMSHCDEFDFVVINDDFDTALSELNALVQAQRLRTSKQKQRYHELFAELLQK